MTRRTAQKPLLGDQLVRRGAITEAQKLHALKTQSEKGGRLGEILVEMGALPEEVLAQVLAENARVPFVHLRKGLVDPRIVHTLPKDKAELYEVLPLFRVRNRLTLAMSDPNRVYIRDIVRKATGCEIQPVLALRDEIVAMIPEAYQAEDIAIEDFVANLDHADVELVSQDTSSRFEDIAEMAGESPIINLVNLFVLNAIKERASDIHIEPERKFFRVRYRIDGMLYEVLRQKIELHAPVVSRLKIMANLDIAERRLPQDGRIQVLAQGRTVDLRFSSLPGVSGEKVVLRVLDKESGVRKLDELGFSPDVLDGFRSMLHRPHGLVLVTGPTGSGKTTTLYGGIRELNSLEKNIVTIEDPVEYQFEIINQNQVREEIGLTFARILKHVLRQDPDIIMVGEIRDSETAKIAVQAALTGHLVLSTLHTNDSASAVSRLIEMGIEPYLLASSLMGVIAQRLVRTICPSCVQPHYPSESELRTLAKSDADGVVLKKGRGCNHCFDSGYRGRLGIYELLVLDAALRALILNDPDVDHIREYQKGSERSDIRADSITKVLEGRTTLEEVARAVFVE